MDCACRITMDAVFMVCDVDTLSPGSDGPDLA